MDRAAETCVDITAAVQSMAVVYLPSHREKKLDWRVSSAPWRSSRMLEYICCADSEAIRGLTEGGYGSSTAWLPSS